MWYKLHIISDFMVFTVTRNYYINFLWWQVSSIIVCLQLYIIKTLKHNRMLKIIKKASILNHNHIFRNKYHNECKAYSCFYKDIHIISYHCDVWSFLGSYGSLLSYHNFCLFMRGSQVKLRMNLSFRNGCLSGVLSSQHQLMICGVG